MKKIFNKLVRDNMVEIFAHDVQNKISAHDYKVRYMLPEETLEKLKDKLLEEMLAIRDAKRKTKGGFEKGTFLEYIDYFDETDLK